MKNIIKKSLRGLLLVPVMALGLSVVAPLVPSTYAATDTTCQDVSGGTGLTINNAANCSRSADQSTSLFGETGVFKTITNVLLFIIGAVAVIMIIIGGLRYTLSGGDSAAVTSAKNTILYGVVGVIVAILAYAIVNFVLGSFTATS
jgi:hypothetical protein